LVENAWFVVLETGSFTGIITMYDFNALFLEIVRIIYECSALQLVNAQKRYVYLGNDKKDCRVRV
jgi:hypothetical protein